jgi:guanosine-3',5'-bis(diphosphate) 3'-pyrophosphohydrolase
VKGQENYRAIDHLFFSPCHNQEAGMTQDSTLRSRTYSQLMLATEYAAEQHRDQRRKGDNDRPYINHPIEVAALLADIGNVTDVNILCAAVLHDTVEDTPTTLDELSNLFGPTITALVAEVSDDRSLSRVERKRLQVLHASKLSDGAKLIKLADKLCNVRDMIQQPPVDWSRDRRMAYIDWAVEVVHQIRGVHAQLEAHFDAVVATCRQSLANG